MAWKSWFCWSRSSRERPRTRPGFWVRGTVLIALPLWWSLQPDLQYVLHPGGWTATLYALVLGRRLDLLF